MSAQVRFLRGIFCLAVLSSVAAQAAVPKPQMIRPQRILKSAGALSGGDAGPSLALMDLRRSYSAKNKMERLVLDFGHADLTPAKSLLGYYHAELQENPPRLILELPQTFSSRLEEKEVRRRLRESIYVREAMIDFDRNLQSMTLVFQLREPIQLQITPVRHSNAPGRLVLDLMPLPPSASRAQSATKGKSVKR